MSDASDETREGGICGKCGRSITKRGERWWHDDTTMDHVPIPKDGECEVCGGALFKTRRAWFHVSPLATDGAHDPVPRAEITFEKVHAPVLHLQSDITLALICSGCGWHRGPFGVPLRMEIVDEAWTEHRAEFAPGTVVDTEPDDERRVEYWRTQAYETDQLNGRLAALVGATVNVLKGEPAPNTMHDWSDIVAVAQREVEALKMWRDRAIEEQERNERMRGRLDTVVSVRDAMERRAKAAEALEAKVDAENDNLSEALLQCVEAFRMTREYVDPAIRLHAVPGWSWYDAVRSACIALSMDLPLWAREAPSGSGGAQVATGAEMPNNTSTTARMDPADFERDPVVTEPETLDGVVRSLLARYGRTRVAWALVQAIDVAGFERGVAEEH